jgi:glycogen synthase
MELHSPVLHGLFITSERPSLVGGLGRVSVDIPMSLNAYANFDCRVITPMTRAVLRLDSQKPIEQRFQPTSVSITLSTQGGGRQKFELWQCFESDTNTWVYAISSPIFTQSDHLYFPGKARFDDDVRKDALGEDGIFHANMLYTRAASAFARWLEPTVNLGSQVKMARFDCAIDFVILNDWLTAHCARELFAEHSKELHPDQAPPLQNAACIFMIHNTYDSRRSLSKARDARLALPEYVEQEIERARINNKDIDKAVLYSPLRTGIKESDWLIVDGNYLATLTTQRTGLSANAKEELCQKRSQRKYTSVVHAPNPSFCPVDSALLQQDDFCALPTSFFQLHCDEQLAVLRQFKRNNKAALQAKWGPSSGGLGYLASNPQAIIMSWAARFDPYQKGFFILAATIKEFLATHENVQLVIAGGGGVELEEEPLVDGFINDLVGDAELAGRVVRAGRRDEHGHVGKLDQKELAQLFAASNALLHPSLYEPYGLSQLEAMWLGVIPIANGVDGLLSTIRDLSDLDGATDSDARPELRYGATGFLMASIGSPLEYERALRAWVAAQRGRSGAKLTEAKQALLDRAHEAFKRLLERSLPVLENEDQYLAMALNAMSYIEQEHSWRKISRRYRQAVESAVLVRKRVAAAPVPAPMLSVNPVAI